MWYVNYWHTRWPVCISPFHSRWGGVFEKDYYCIPPKVGLSTWIWVVCNPVAAFFKSGPTPRALRALYPHIRGLCTKTERSWQQYKKIKNDSHDCVRPFCIKWWILFLSAILYFPLYFALRIFYLTPPITLFHFFLFQGCRFCVFPLWGYHTTSTGVWHLDPGVHLVLRKGASAYCSCLFESIPYTTVHNALTPTCICGSVFAGRYVVWQEKIAVDGTFSPATMPPATAILRGKKTKWALPHYLGSALPWFLQLARCMGRQEQY